MKVVGTGALFGAVTVVRDVGLVQNTVPPAVTGITGDAVGATLVDGKTVGNTVWFVDTGGALAGGLLDKSETSRLISSEEDDLTGRVTVDIGNDVVVAKGADAVAVTDGAFVPWGVVVDWGTRTWLVSSR